MQRLTHLHIPKTAGTSLGHAFIETYGPHEVYFYDSGHGRAVRSSRRITAGNRPTLDRLKTAVHKHHAFRIVKPLFKMGKRVERVLGQDPAELVREEFAVLTGHFDAGQLSSWGLDQPPAVTVVRDPLERAWSQYQNWRRTQGLSGTYHHFDISYSPDVPFESYALHPAMANFQSQLLGALSMKYVGVSEHLPDLIEELGLHVEETPRMNTGGYDGLPAFDPGFVRDFTAANRADYELFTAAQDRWAA